MYGDEVIDNILFLILSCIFLYIVQHAFHLDSGYLILIFMLMSLFKPK